MFSIALPCSFLNPPPGPLKIRNSSEAKSAAQKAWQGSPVHVTKVHLLNRGIGFLRSCPLPFPPWLILNQGTLYVFRLLFI